MRNLRLCLSLLILGACLWGCSASHTDARPKVEERAERPAARETVIVGETNMKENQDVDENQTDADVEWNLSDADWKRRLTPEQYRILRQHGTERAFTGDFWNAKDEGHYVCAGCGNELFSSDTKFDSGTGWPSFWEPSSEQSLKENQDRSFGMVRNEVLCRRCGGHLGHVFDDGPEPTGQRYCINSGALDLRGNVEE